MQPDEPRISPKSTVLQREDYQSLQPVSRPTWWGVDADPATRPGVPMLRDPKPWPNTRFPPDRQKGKPSSPLHGRSNKSPVPVFSTAVPLRGISGLIRRLAYRSPDHRTRHWLLLMLGDRVDVWSHRLSPLVLIGLPVALAGLALWRPPSR